MNSIFFNAIAAVAIATSLPSPAQSQSTADAPVTVGSCSVVPAYDFAESGENGILGVASGANLWVSFQNRSARTATDVTFLLSTAGGATTVTDRGRFSSNVEIRHTLGPFADLRGDETCRLYAVRFDDGQVWQQP